MYFNRRRTRLIESSAKCRYLKKLTCKGTLLQVFYLPEALSPPMTPCPPLHTEFYHTVYFFTHGRGDGGELTRDWEKVRGAIVHKAGRKYQHDWLYLQPVNSIKHQNRRHLGFGFFSFLVHDFNSIIIFWYGGLILNQPILLNIVILEIHSKYKGRCYRLAASYSKLA